MIDLIKKHATLLFYIFLLFLFILSQYIEADYIFAIIVIIIVIFILYFIIKAIMMLIKMYNNPKSISFNNDLNYFHDILLKYNSEILTYMNNKEYPSLYLTILFKKLHPDKYIISEQEEDIMDNLTYKDEIDIDEYKTYKNHIKEELIKENLLEESELISVNYLGIKIPMFIISFIVLSYIFIEYINRGIGATLLIFTIIASFYALLLPIYRANNYASRKYQKYTKEGKIIYGKLKGFKKYLKRASKYEAINSWEDYEIYMTILGLNKEYYKEYKKTYKIVQ